MLKFLLHVVCDRLILIGFSSMACAPALKGFMLAAELFSPDGILFSVKKYF